MPSLLVLLTGYPCSIIPWGSTNNHGSPEVSAMESFYAGARYLKNLLQGDRCDYICTTWDDIGRKEIFDTYLPVRYKSFSQDEFRDKIDNKLVNYERDRLSKRTAFYSGLGQVNVTVSSSIRASSQLQLRCYACQLALNYMDSTNKKYDAILITRYDISTRGGFLVRHPSKLTSDDLKFIQSSYVSPRIILPVFSQLNCGFPDMWFYMNRAAINYYKKILNGYINDITNKSSEYIEMMQSGWPLSRSFELHSMLDHNQYSNEIFKNNPTCNLMKYPDWEVPNLHSYYKYFFSLSTSRPNDCKIRFKNRIQIFISCIANKRSLKDGFIYIKEMIVFIRFLLKISSDRLFRHILN
jgi:hypothetical protein